jgi:acyl-CoA dehydrogenase
VSFLVIERGGGVEARALSKLGWRASDTAEIAFDEVFVPAGQLLGELDRGFRLIMANFQWERLVMALGAVGAMRRTLERVTVELAGRGQATRHRVADLATRAEAGTALTYHALRRYLAGGDAVREVTMAKLATQRANFDLQDECLRPGRPGPGARAGRPRRPPRPDRRRDRRDHARDPRALAGPVTKGGQTPLAWILVPGPPQRCG